MEFCPTCGMLLKYELPHMSRPARFFCPTCPYVTQIEPKVKIKRKQRLVKKAVDPIITKDDMSNAPKTDQGIYVSQFVKTDSYVYNSGLRF
ncbi:putative DNA-directed RNA polymerase, M/15kDa subunit, nudix hydrolase [Helianthus anomalus]